MSSSAALCLLNPRAASGRCAQWREPLSAALKEHAHGLPLVIPDDVAAARQALAELPRGSRVIVAGGDGTVHQLLPALLAHEHELALLPGGTGNDLARALNLKRFGWREALHWALQAPGGRMDVGELRCEGRSQPFMSSLTVGFDAAVCARAMRTPPWLRGMPRYLWATLGEIRSLRRYPMRVRARDQMLLDEEVVFASSLNTRSYASGMPVAPDARVDDGLLELISLSRYGRLGVLCALPALLLGQHLRLPHVRLQRYEALQISSPTLLPLALDGEPVPGAHQLEVAVRPLALRVVAGPGAIEHGA